MPKPKKVVGAPVPAHPPSEERVLQGTMMLQRKLLGTTIEEIAREFRTTQGIVRSRLTEARESGVLIQAQLLLLEKLLPAAIGAYQHALTDEHGDAELRLKAAKDILFGTQALETKSKATVVHETQPDTLEAYRAARLRKALPGEVEVEVLDESK